jgi:hypothetical protein
MTVLVIGASAQALRQIRAMAPAGVDVVDEALAEPDWVLVATTSQRIAAVGSRGLPPYRVLEVPEIASGLEPPEAEALRTALVKMAGIGASRPLISSIGVTLVRAFVGRQTHDAGAATPSSFDDVATTTAILRTIPARMPSGARLDELLAARARQRVDRFVAQTVRWIDERSS